MKLHDILHELVDAVATFTDNHRAEIHAGIDELETLSHDEPPAQTPGPAAPAVQAPAEAPETAGPPTVSPAE